MIIPYLYGGKPPVFLYYVKYTIIFPPKMPLLGVESNAILISFTLIACILAFAHSLALPEKIAVCQYVLKFFVTVQFGQRW